jgi:hypothetical protein
MITWKLGLISFVDWRSILLCFPLLSYIPFSFFLSHSPKPNSQFFAFPLCANPFLVLFFHKLCFVIFGEFSFIESHSWWGLKTSAFLLFWDLSNCCTAITHSLTINMEILVIRKKYIFWIVLDS